MSTQDTKAAAPFASLLNMDVRGIPNCVAAGAAWVNSRSSLEKQRLVEYAILEVPQGYRQVLFTQPEELGLITDLQLPIVRPRVDLPNCAQAWLWFPRLYMFYLSRSELDTFSQPRVFSHRLYVFTAEFNTLEVFYSKRLQVKVSPFNFLNTDSATGASCLRFNTGAHSCFRERVTGAYESYLYSPFTQDLPPKLTTEQLLFTGRILRAAPAAPADFGTSARFIAVARHLSRPKQEGDETEEQLILRHKTLVNEYYYQNTAEGTLRSFIDRALTQHGLLSEIISWT